MPENNQLRRSFFARDTLTVARELLGMRLVRLEAGERLSGLILETEAYIGETDQACHARAGLTPRTSVMYGPPGHAYVYFTYGMHWMLNFVTQDEHYPAAVLIRAIQPTEGINLIGARRANQPAHLWTNGPAKLCQALAIDGKLNGLDICTDQTTLWVEPSTPVPSEYVTTSPRVGLYTIAEPWKSKPWRFRAHLP